MQTGKIPTRKQVSCGGVAFRTHNGHLEVALINVDTEQRWQLPKGTLMGEESCEEAALREVLEETGLTTKLLAPIAKIEYWFYSRYRGKPVRIHKVVHFFCSAIFQETPGTTTRK